MDKSSQWNERKLRRQEPPWQENINQTPEFILRYQVQNRSIEDTLAADLEMLKQMAQVIFEIAKQFFDNFIVICGSFFFCERSRKW